MDFLELAIALALLLANAFFVLVEFSLVKARLTRLEELSNHGSLNAAIAQENIRKLNEYLSACQLGITMASLGLGWIGEPALARLLQPLLDGLPIEGVHAISYSLSFGIAFILITFMHVVAGELAPKTIAIQFAERSAMITARPIRWFYRAFFTPMSILNASSNLLLRPFGILPISNPEMVHSEEELRLLISHAGEHRGFPLRRLLLFENLFDFGDQKVKDVMIQKENIAFLSLNDSWEATLKTLGGRKYTRFPLCTHANEDPVGYVHLKDLGLLLAQAQPGTLPDLGQIKRDLLWTAENTSLENALSEFQMKKIPIALVKDSSGRLSGLVTLEDILEELVGEIRDEFDATPTVTLLEAWVPEALDLGMSAPDRRSAIQHLLQKLHDARPDFNYKEAFDAIWKRETGLSSAIGSEIALPHGRLQDLSKPLLAIGRSTAGIPFDAPDKKTVKFIFLILTPLQQPTAQLRILSRIASLMSNRSLRRRLTNAHNTSEVADILKAFAQGMPI